MQWKLAFIFLYKFGTANSDRREPTDISKPIPNTELYQAANELWNETNSLLDCDFINGPCYWRQQVDFGFSYPIWTHQQSPAGISLTGDGSGNYYHIPKLVSQAIQTSNTACFHFNYKTNVTVSVIQEHVDNAPGNVVFRSNSDGLNINAGYATILDGKYHIYFQIEDDINEYPLVFLSNFYVSNYTGSVCEMDDAADDTDVKEHSGDTIIPMHDSTKSCKWIQFGESFHDVPQVVLQTMEYGVRTSVDYVGFSGFRLCAFGPPTNYYSSVNVKWRATIDIQECFEKDQFKCKSGECIPRKGLCDGHADCLSADDENTDLCAAAMGTLAFSTFASTIMVTYLITYLKYVRDIRQIFLEPLAREENRLESIHMRELSREAQDDSVTTINIPTQ
jgi:hypothetical protein